MKKLLYTLTAGILLLVTSLANAASIDIDFTVDGDTYTQPWSITNNSTNGILLESFVFDLRPLLTYCYDLDSSDCNSSAGTLFSANSGATSTGYVNSVVSNEPGGVDFNDVLEMNFNDFGEGETFSWLIDVDSLNDFSVFGNELIGSTAYATMSNGRVYFGTLEGIIGNDDASRFVISDSYNVSVSEPATLVLFGLGLMAFGARRLRLNNN